MVKLLQQSYVSKIIGSIILFLLLISPNSASNNAHIEAEIIYKEAPVPINIDFDEIKSRGTLRMITRYSSTSYFLHSGRDRGFEYELVSRFARENGLKVEVILIDSDEDPIQMLESGVGDLIADHFRINDDLQKLVSFRRPYNFINQVYDEGEAKSESIAWATRKNAPTLKQKIDDFIGSHIQVRKSDGKILRSAYLNNLSRRYFEQDRLESRSHDRAFDAIYSGYLSPYDDMVKSIADEAGVDWKLVIAVMAQESAFNPNAESYAGAMGLMQIIPRFSKVMDKNSLYEPEINVREGVRYLKKHLNRESHLDSLNQYSMALAAYNVGSGNLADARELAVKLGTNPDEWTNIADALLKLMEPKYYKHARFGYKRGTETVNYVQDVLIRYSRYQSIYKMAEDYREGMNRETILVSRN